MYATMNARRAPTPSPNKIPSGTEFTLRAKNPAAIPAINPLTVEPTMIPANCARTDGVNHAVPPSIAPRSAPNSNPSRTLFIAFPPPLVSLTTELIIPLRLALQNQQQDQPHQQVRCNQ